MSITYITVILIDGCSIHSLITKENVSARLYTQCTGRFKEVTICRSAYLRFVGYIRARRMPRTHQKLRRSYN